MRQHLQIHSLLHPSFLFPSKENNRMINDGRSVEFDRMMLVMKQCATIDRSILHQLQISRTLLRRSTSRVVLAYLSIHVLKNELAQMGETRKACPCPPPPPPGQNQLLYWLVGTSGYAEKNGTASPSQSNVPLFYSFKC